MVGEAILMRKTRKAGGPRRKVTGHAAHTCGMPYWSMTCQMYQSSFRDDFLNRKVVTKAYSSGSP